MSVNSLQCLEWCCYGERLIRHELELRQVPFNKEKCKVLYSAGGAGCTGVATEQCVVTYENKAIWTCRQTVRKRFTLESEILQACWVNFHSQAGGDSGSSSNASTGSVTAAALQAAGTAAATPTVTPVGRTARLHAPGTAAPTAQQHAVGGYSREANPSPLGHIPAGSQPVAVDARDVGGGTVGAAATRAAPSPTSGAAVAAGTDVHAAGAGLATPAPGAAAKAPDKQASGDHADAAGDQRSVDEAVLCLLQKSSITCIYPSGEVLETPLLQPCTALWPLTVGVVMVGPADSSASVLSHPLKEPHPVVADCALSSSNSRSSVAAYAGWSQERIVWSSRELPYVATYNEMRGRLAIWHMRAMPPEAAGIGSSVDLPVVSPLGWLQPRTPIATGASPFGSAFGSAGGAYSYGGGFGSAAGYSSGGFGAGSGTAAYSSSLLSPIIAGSGTRTVTSAGGASTVKRSSLRTPQGCLPASIFNPTPQNSTQAPWASGLGALGPLRPCFSNTTQAQQALLLPGPDAAVLFKLVCHEELADGAEPVEACVATDADGCALLCLLCKGGAQQLLAFRLPRDGSKHIVVKRAFSIPAVAAVPVATGFSISSHNSTDSSSSRQRYDLLVLSPSGKLLLYRGSQLLVPISLQLPTDSLQVLTSAAAAAAAVRLHRGSAPGRSNKKGIPGTPGSLGCWSMSEGSEGEEDDMMLSPGSAKGGPRQTAGPAAAALGSQIRLVGLSCPVEDRFNVDLDLGLDSSQTGTTGCEVARPFASLRIRLGLSWLPTLPQQVLQALQDVLPQQRYQQLLAACLVQPGACSGHLGKEWRAITTVLLAAALNPSFLNQAVAAAAVSQQNTVGAAEAAAVILNQSAGQFGSPVAGEAAAAPSPPAAAAAAAHGDSGNDDDMDMATPATGKKARRLSAADATAAAAAPQQQAFETPASVYSVDMDMATPETCKPKSRLSAQGLGAAPAAAAASGFAAQRAMHTPASAPSSMSMSISVDAMSGAEPSGRGSRGVTATPMSVSTVRLASRLGQQQLSSRALGMHSSQDALAIAGGQGPDSAVYFPTAASPGGEVGMQQQQQQQVSAKSPDVAWQQLLASQDSRQLLQMLPCLQARQQQQPQQRFTGITRAATGYNQHQQQAGGFPKQQHQQQQQQQHRDELFAVLQSLHSVYEDCKLNKRRLYLLQLLGPLLWTLASWLAASSYREHYERDASPTGLAHASRQLCTAAAALAGQQAPDPAGQTVLFPEHAGGTSSSGYPTPPPVAAGNCNSGSSMLEPPGDIMRCLSLLLSGSSKYKRYLPVLASKGSSCVSRSCQLIEAYQILAACTSSCAAAIAASTVAQHKQQQQDAASSFAGFTLAGFSFNSSSNSSIADGIGVAGALEAELEYLLLRSSHQLVLLLVQQGWDVLALDELPVGLALPVKEAVTRCRTNPPPGWPIMAYALIGREDVAATLASNESAAAAAASCTSGIAPSNSNKGVTTRNADAGSETVSPDAQAAQSALKPCHLLLPYEQRLLLPSSSSMTGQQINHRPLSGAPQPNTSSKTTNTTAAAASARTSSRGMGLRGTAAAAAAAGQHPDALSHWQSGATGELGMPIDGMEGVASGVSALRFARDDRLAEVISLLGTNMPVVLNVPGSDTDPDLPVKQQAALLSSAIRTMALPLGRGAFTLGLSDPLPGEHLAVPLLCLSGVAAGPGSDSGAAGGRVLVNLDLTNAQPAPGGGAAADVTAWCEFHNGVASGIKITPRRRCRQQFRNQQQQQQHGISEAAPASTDADTLADSWLPHSKPVVPNYANAGVLLALGLSGHLDRLSWTDLYRYLSDQHDATTIGVLLGMSACCRGSADTTVARMLFLHLPARHPNTFPEIELSPNVQAASLLGLGLLYQGSCHRLMTETMLEEIGRTPGVNPSAANSSGTGGLSGGGLGAGGSLASLMSVTHDRESYALAAGFGLGLICLGQGRNAPGLADLHLEDKLRAFMDATTQPHTLARKPLNSAQSKADTTSAASGHLTRSKPQNVLDSVLGPGVVRWDAVLGDDPTGTSAAAAAAAAGALKMDADHMQQYGLSQVVLEGPSVNTMVTGPAAAMALMMMYLKTGDADVAARLKVPDTTYALNHMRPDMVLLMVLGRALIMWHDISASQEWLSEQLPPSLDLPVATILDHMLSPAAGPAATGTVGGLGRGLRAGESGAPVDWGAVGLAHVHALAGACFAIGLRFAGTCNANAEALLRHHLLQLLHAKRRAPPGPNDQSVAPVVAMAAAAAAANGGIGIAVTPAAASVGKLDKAAIENCMVVVLLSLSLVTAGSGHLPTFRLIQVLSRRTAGPLRATGAEGQTPGGVATMLGGPGVGSGNINYGHHLAVSLSAGLLFLSAGRSSISTSNESIAALLIALYPVWPNSPTDQRCHLQAFRHLYVLAVEPRCLQAVDVHSRQQVVVPLDITAHKDDLIGPVPPEPAAAEELQQQQQQQAGVQGLMAMGQQQQPKSTAAGGVAPAAAVPAGRRAARQLLQPEQQQVHSATRVQAVTPPLKPGLPVPSPAAARAGTPNGMKPQSQLATAAVGGGSNTISTTGGSSSNSSIEIVHIKRQAPCLLPERQHLVSLQVCGPRYWPIQVTSSPDSSSGNSSSSWSHMYLQQRICVKKKAGSLPYAEDPSGVKSLLFKAFYCGCDAAAALGAGADGATALGTASSSSSTQGQQQQQSFDIVHLCNTFSADPQIQAFAQIYRAAAAALPKPFVLTQQQQQQQLSAGLGASLAVAAATATTGSRNASAFLAFCTGALYECIVQEKTVVLLWYMQLYALAHRVCAAAAAGAAPAECSSSSQLQPLLLLGDAAHGLCNRWGCSMMLNPAVQLQDLVLVRRYYDSSIAAAAGLCRAAAVKTSSSSRTQGQQQQEAWQVEALGWLPLLQPGFCDSLWKALLQHWQKARVLPTAHGLSTAGGSISSGNTSRESGTHSSALQAYLASGSITAAAAAGPATVQAQHGGRCYAAGAASGATPESSSLGLSVEVAEQLLGSCLALMSIPSAEHLQGTFAGILQQQGQQSTASLHDSSGMEAVLKRWAPQLAEQLPDVSGAALLALAAAAASRSHASS